MLRKKKKIIYSLYKKLIDIIGGLNWSSTIKAYNNIIINKIESKVHSIFTPKKSCIEQNYYSW